MSYAVRLSDNAQGDLLSITEFISRDSPLRARTFVAELEVRFVRKLSAFPLSGVVFQSVRYAAFGNYVLIYRVDDVSKVVVVLMVTEGHRDWRRLIEGLN